MLFAFLYIPILFIAWALVFPVQALVMIENLKQWQARLIIQHLISKDIRLLKEQFRKWGNQNGYEQRLINETLDKYILEIVQRVESRYSHLNIDELFQ